jgi:hypothetical protein
MTTSNTQLILLRPDFDAITAGGMVLLVVVMSIAWLGAINRINPRQGLWTGLTVLLIALANVMGDQLN